MKTLPEYITAIPDFPKPGILFRDMSPLLADPDAFAFAVELLGSRWAHERPTKIGAFDARGFIFAGALAVRMGLPFFMLRKKGKLPGNVVKKTYDLEYGGDTIEMHRDAVSPGDRVILVDDLLATGGTARAGKELIESLGATVIGLSVVMELGELGGREKFGGEVYSLITYGKTIETADAIALYNGKIVLVERLHYPFGLALPGGHVDPGETTRVTAAREFNEETGLWLRDDTVEFVSRVDKKWRDPRYESSATDVYAGNAEGLPHDEEHLTKVVFMTPEEILATPDERFAFDHGAILKEYLKSKMK